MLKFKLMQRSRPAASNPANPDRWWGVAFFAVLLLVSQSLAATSPGLGRGSPSSGPASSAAKSTASPNPSTPALTPLEARMAAVLSSTDLGRGFWGIEVRSLATGKVLFSQNADKLFTPASNTKLFTTAAALALIGPDYKFHTSVETTGNLDRYGRLNGDVVLVGR